jgi:hypothetical protein
VQSKDCVLNEGFFQILAAGFLDTMKGIGETIRDGDVKNALERNVGLFLHCKVNSVNMVMALCTEIS